MSLLSSCAPVRPQTRRATQHAESSQVQTSPFAQLATLTPFEPALQDVQETKGPDSGPRKEGEAARPCVELPQAACGATTSSDDSGFWADVGTPGGSPVSVTPSADANFIDWDACLEHFRESMLRASALPRAPRTGPAPVSKCCSRHVASSNRVLLPWDLD